MGIPAKVSSEHYLLKLGNSFMHLSRYISVCGLLVLLNSIILRNVGDKAEVLNAMKTDFV